jgi:CheY-like chemotaxis protein
VYGIVKQSGGNIWVYSEPEKGTRFKIYLPRTLGLPAEKARVAEKRARGGGREHILVVEDNDGLRRLMAAMLSGHGYAVTLAANGGEALLLVEEKGLNPDLIITDVVMPNMSGRELIDRLRRANPHLRALYMSGYTDDAILRHGVSDASVHFMEKPFSLETLLSNVRLALEGDKTPNVQ